jgi:heterotetrameric sarcosine oxidase gamma subunit
MTAPRYHAAITRLPTIAAFNARGAAPAIERAILASSLPWPKAMQRLATDGTGLSVLRLGPRNVMVLAPMELEADTHRALDNSFAAESEADVALVSDMYVTFSVTGRGAEDVLRQGAPLDLSAPALPVDAAAGTELWGTTAIILRRPAIEPVYHVMVEASYAGYIEDWLTVANGGASTLKPGTMANPPPSLRPA